jgi:hypothetical protein
MSPFIAGTYHWLVTEKRKKCQDRNGRLKIQSIVKGSSISTRRQPPLGRIGIFSPLRHFRKYFAQLSHENGGKANKCSTHMCCKRAARPQCLHFRRQIQQLTLWSQPLDVRACGWMEWVKICEFSTRNDSIRLTLASAGDQLSLIFSSTSFHCLISVYFKEKIMEWPRGGRWSARLEFSV